ncbi:superfamily I DNA and RNA helicase [Rhodovulum sulfidophilum]|uniref:DEAD/DEAH box helicase n=1 Tax=Rhodovulum sulfidophilum TaxID=35806 RepID=UPI0005AA3DE2|nr:ATP-binding domain-containing protein [Rhodovulum sulfidophilum]ANB35848.1 DNA helicase [Rhodovulum sulfidophilum DSM 1374]ANB39659.1 DNA helicase [Rhodovulum sulfidophilum]MCW2305527.1 superfamily I DNA and RNA helicase [Rhodovulum sulfidophilum]
MTSSFFFLQAEKDERNQALYDELENWSSKKSAQIYIVNQPLGDDRYDYDNEDCAVVMSPGRKICLINFSEDEDGFSEFIEDFLEDVGSISDKYEYKDAIGRPRKWRKDLIFTVPDGAEYDIERYIQDSRIEDPGKRRLSELVISLVTGSINDIERATAEVPDNLLDKVKQKIQLFDADQTRFIYKPINKKSVHIQGLSGTGKTELLLHKLKDIYIRNPSSRILLTCHNRILADNLRKRIPEFFNFMKVEQQIEWDRRLWCMHAWGSRGNPNSGTYRYICHYFDVPFYTFGQSSFDAACKAAIEAIKAKKEGLEYAFEYILIDESQDFPQSFLDLCELVAKEYVIIAGDIFQSIFDAKIKPSISPDFLLSKCYRTDPRALMFAHSLGMGLFEEKKLRWLDDDEWQTCGYIVEATFDKSFYRLKREPLRRFEDISAADVPSVSIIEGEAFDNKKVAELVLEAIRSISEENPTITPDDIGIILVDDGNQIYALQDTLAQIIPRETGWIVNKAVESKRKLHGRLFISNRNNVKGLEFPFVICVTSNLSRGLAYRNSLYMTLTRSFLRSYLIVSQKQDETMMARIRQGLNTINASGFIEVQPPSVEERAEIMTTITQDNVRTSFYDFCEDIFDEIGILPIFRQELRRVIRATSGEEFDRHEISEIAEFNYRKMLKKEGL